MPKRGKKKAVIVKKKLAENHSDDGIASYESDSEYRYEEADEDSSYECYS